MQKQYWEMTDDEIAKEVRFEVVDQTLPPDENYSWGTIRRRWMTEEQVKQLKSSNNLGEKE